MCNRNGNNRLMSHNDKLTLNLTYNQIRSCDNNVCSFKYWEQGTLTLVLQAKFSPKIMLWFISFNWLLASHDDP